MDTNASIVSTVTAPAVNACVTIDGNCNQCSGNSSYLSISDDIQITLDEQNGDPQNPEDPNVNTNDYSAGPQFPVLSQKDSQRYKILRQILLFEGLIALGSDTTNVNNLIMHTTDDSSGAVTGCTTKRAIDLVPAGYDPTLRQNPDDCANCSSDSPFAHPVNNRRPTRRACGACPQQGTGSPVGSAALELDNFIVDQNLLSVYYNGTLTPLWPELFNNQVIINPACACTADPALTTDMQNAINFFKNVMGINISKNIEIPFESNCCCEIYTPKERTCL